MEHKQFVVASVILILLVAGMFGFAYIKKKELNTTPTPRETKNEPDLRYNGITQIDAKHFFIDGVHTIAGEILMPTPCDLLNWNDPMIAESFPEQVRIDFTVVNTADTCAQVVTPQRFKVSFTASDKAMITATLQGRALPLNLIPAAPNETPDSFELFIKG